MQHALLEEKKESPKRKTEIFHADMSASVQHALPGGKKIQSLQKPKNQIFQAKQNADTNASVHTVQHALL